MMNGASTLEGYIARYRCDHRHPHARCRRAPFVGKVHCEYFCFSGGSHTCAAGPVHNPHKMGYSAGGSSSGSAVVVATGEADMAIGGDQGGSIRIPAAFSGIYGMKATYGLVPYTGVMPIELTIDHTGPMTANVRDNALLLEVLAGADGLDPRQGALKVAKIHRASSTAASGDCASASSGRLWASEFGSATSMPRSRRAPTCSASSAPPSTKSRSRCISSRPRSGCRSPPKAPPSS